MPLSFDDVTGYADMLSELQSRAREALGERLLGLSETSRDAAAEQARIAFADVFEKYGAQANELAAQWYELCADRAGVKVDPALFQELNMSGLDAHVKNLLKRYVNGEEDLDTAIEFMLDMMGEEVMQTSRDQIFKSLDRDHSYARRTGRKGRTGYARVPTGRETCAWCFMLASRGYVYKSFESAGGLDPDHYHPHCDCVVVAYNEPTAIAGYGDQYNRYLGMYETARDAWESGNISEDLAERIEAARIRHEAKYAAGETNVPWSDQNEITMVMREQNGLSH